VVIEDHFRLGGPLLLSQAAFDLIRLFDGQKTHAVIQAETSILFGEAISLDIIANLVANAKTAQQVIADAVSRLPYERTCECATALKHAILTRPDAVPDRVKQDLAPIIGRYMQ